MSRSRVPDFVGIKFWAEIFCLAVAVDVCYVGHTVMPACKASLVRRSEAVSENGSIGSVLGVDM